MYLYLLIFVICVLIYICSKYIYGTMFDVLKYKIVLIGSKRYDKALFMDVVLDSFNSNWRFNWSLPSPCFGTKYHNLYLNSHVYDHCAKKNDARKAKQKYKEISFEHFDLFFKNKQQYNKIEKQSTDWKRFNTFLKKQKCPHTFKKLPRVGMIKMMEIIMEKKKPFLYGFSLYDENDEHQLKEKPSLSNCHDRNVEMKILRWLHMHNFIDASLCLIEDKPKLQWAPCELNPTPLIKNIMEHYMSQSSEASPPSVHADVDSTPESIHTILKTKGVYVLKGFSTNHSEVQREFDAIIQSNAFQKDKDTGNNNAIRTTLKKINAFKASYELFQSPWIIELCTLFHINYKNDPKDLFIHHDFECLETNNTYPHFDKHRKLKFYLCVNDLDETNGCFKVIPDQLEEVEKLRRTNGPYKNIFDSSHPSFCGKQYNISDMIPVIAKAGDLIIFDTNCIHAGGDAFQQGKSRKVMRLHLKYNHST